MVSYFWFDPAKPGGNQKICSLSDEVLTIFPDLALTPQEREWCNLTPKELISEAERNEYAIKNFRQKLDCCSVVDGLLGSDPESVKRGIKKVSTHLTGGPLDKYFFRQAHKIRSNAGLQERIQPVLNALVEAACSELKSYVNYSRPDALDNSYRHFYIFAVTVARLNPSIAPDLRQEFLRILGGRRHELSPYLFLESLPAVGYLPKQITEWDEKYINLWRCDPGSAEGRARGVNIAAYNARPSIGWGLMKMHPHQADRLSILQRDSILRSLVLEMYRKCTQDSSVNAAWLAARFLKLHLALHVLNGRHAYKRLPADLVLRVQRIAETVSAAMRGSTDNFDGRLEVQKIAGAVVAICRQLRSAQN